MNCLHPLWDCVGAGVVTQREDACLGQRGGHCDHYGPSAPSHHILQEKLEIWLLREFFWL